MPFLMGAWVFLIGKRKPRRLAKEAMQAENI
jgi:hypothetical protein